MPWSFDRLPFFEDRHQAWAERLVQSWPRKSLPEPQTQEETSAEVKMLVRELGEAELLDCVVPPRGPDAKRRIDVRSLCIAREYFGYENMCVDTAFTMQGIGSAMLWMSGSEHLQNTYLERFRTGQAIAAFAMSEPDGGSDLGNLKTSARRDGNHYVLNGQKTWISNAGIADHYIVLARTGEAPGARGLSAFMVDADTPGFKVTELIEMMVAHSLGSLSFEDCRVPATNMIGEPGKGFSGAMQTFDIFRPSVGAVAVGMARRAFDETMDHVAGRTLFGQPMAQVPGVQFKLAEMATELTAAALTVYRAAWSIDTGGEGRSREASMAKLFASEAAGRVVDAAVQLFGGRGLRKGYKVEQLYREIRGSRIYEGASEVQKLIIARKLLKAHAQ